MPDVEYLSYGVVEERDWTLQDAEIFERAAEADLGREDHGRMEVSNQETILDAAEREDLSWSLKCLKGRCGRCSALVVDGEISMDAEQQFLTSEEVESKSLCLPCVSEPETDIKLVYGVRHLDALQDRVK